MSMKHPNSLDGVPISGSDASYGSASINPCDLAVKRICKAPEGDIVVFSDL